MGNRGLIKDINSNTGIYLHWNGGRDSVEAFLEYCKLKGYRGSSDSSYCISRLTQVIANFFGGSLSIGIQEDITDDDIRCADNGLYIIKDFEIVERKPEKVYEQNEYDKLEMLVAIDNSQPKNEQLGSYLGAIEIPIDELKIGDNVFIDSHFDNKHVICQIAGIGEDIIVNGRNVKGIPYINKYSINNDFSNNPNNYIGAKTVRIPKLTEEYKKIKIEELKSNFNNKSVDTVLLYIPSIKQYISFAFGDGSNADTLSDGCDDYIYITQYEFTGSDFEEVDGGMLEFNSEEAGYDNNIYNALFDVLDFIYGNECLEFEIMTRA